MRRLPAASPADCGLLRPILVNCALLRLIADFCGLLQPVCRRRGPPPQDNRDALAAYCVRQPRRAGARSCACYAHVRACLCMRARVLVRTCARTCALPCAITAQHTFAYDVFMHTIAQHTHASRAFRGHARDAGHARDLDANRWESVRLDQGGRVACVCELLRIENNDSQSRAISEKRTIRMHTTIAITGNQ